MEYKPKRTFLVRQDEVEGGKKKDVIAHRGKKINLSDREAIKFWGSLDLDDKDKKRLMGVAKAQKLTRTV